MKKLIYLILFIPVIGFGQTYPHQIEPDTTHRMIMMTDTSVIDSPSMEFLYFSIDSLVRQIAVDTLGLQGGHWSKDDSLSLSPVSQTNNIVLGSLSGNTSLSGSYNFIAGGGLGNGLTSGSYNTLFGSNVAASLTTNNGNTVFGNSIAPLATSLQYSTLFGGNIASNATDLRFSFIAGYDNLKNATGLSQYSFINGNGLANGGNVQYSFLNGFDQASTSSGVTFTFVNGYLNFEGAGDVYGSFASGRENFKSNTGQILYSSALGRDNFFSSGSASYSNGFGYQNLYTASSPFASTGIGEGNFKLSSDADYSIGIGYRNLYTSTFANNYVIALGRENANTNVDHSNSVLIGYRQNYTSGGTNRLAIGMAQDDPLISGHFTSDWIRINGYLEIRDKSGTPGNILALDGDKIVDSGQSLSSLTNYWRLNAGTLYSHETTGTRDVIVGDLQFTDRGSTPVGLVGRDASNWLENIAVGTGLTLTGSTLTADVVDDPEWTNISGVLYSDYNPGSSLTLKDIKVDQIEFNTATATATNTLLARNSSGRIAGVSIGSGLSFSSGTLSATSTNLWTDAGTYYRPNNLGDGSGATFRIYDSGKVAIGGTSEPTQKVAINGDLRVTSDISTAGDLVATSPGTSYVDSDGDSGASGELLGHDGSGLDWLTPEISLTPPVLMCYQSSAQSISSTGGFIAVPNTVNDSGFGTSDTQKTVPLTGYYRVSAAGTVTASTGNGFNYAINGGVTVTQSVDTAGSYGFSYTTILYMTSGTTVGLYMDATSSGNTVDEISLDINYIKS